MIAPVRRRGADPTVTVARAIPGPDEAEPRRLLAEQDAEEEEQRRLEEQERQARIATGEETEDGVLGPLALYENLMQHARPCLSRTTPAAVARVYQAGSSDPCRMTAGTSSNYVSGSRGYWRRGFCKVEQ